MSAIEELRLQVGVTDLLYDFDNNTYGKLTKAVDAVERENAKLRELVEDMFGGYRGAVEMLPSSYSKNVAEMAVMDISDRMCELGVEVD